MIAAASAGGLYALAPRSESPAYWPALRRFAASSRDQEQSGLAYLTLGYREYEAGQYPAAIADLGRAADSRCSLADFAAYYEAEAAWAAHDNALVVRSLEGFADRYPESSVVQQATALLAAAELKMQQPARAIHALKSDPRLEKSPSLILLLGRSYEGAQKLEDAARAYQDVYYNFPATAPADDAGAALDSLRQRLTVSFPRVSEQLATSRADFLLAAEDYREALKDYRSLASRYPGSGLANLWRVGEARSLVGLHRAKEAIGLIGGREFKDGEAESGRLDTLVRAGRQLKDEHVMLAALSELEKRFAHTGEYATALWTVSNYFLAQDERASAVRYYEVLEADFPLAWQGREAQWRATWSHYLEGDYEQAELGFREHLKRYPGSPHAAGALYWLGRLEERKSDPATAQALYQLLRQRFVSDYYALEAGRRPASLDSSHPSPEQALLEDPHVPAGVALAAEAPAKSASALAGASWVALVAKDLPSRSPSPEGVCSALSLSGSGDIERRLRLMQALGLESLEGGYIQHLLTEHPPVSSSGASRGLRLALSSLEQKDGRYSVSIYQARRAFPNYADYGTSELPGQVWNLLYPRAFWDLVRTQSRANGLDPYLVMALIRQESGFNPKATSHANARGLMQMLPVAAGARGRSKRSRRVARSLYDPAYNVRVACRFLRGVLHTFGGKPEFALAAYNAGDNRVRGWLNDHSFDDVTEFVESIPFNETRLYVQAVLRDAALYRRILSVSAKFGSCE